MNRTKIEYLDYCWNFVTGCNNWRDPKICGGGGSEFKCWAKSMAERFGRSFAPCYNHQEFLSFTSPENPSRIGVCFTSDLFSNDFPVYSPLFDVIKMFPKHQYYFLTKCPWNLRKWGEFPDSAWVGVSVTNQRQHNQAIAILAGVKAKHKWISYEPLLENINFTSPYALKGIDWVVIGGLSNQSSKKQPPRDWIDHIIENAHKFDVPVFIKNNLRCRFPEAADMWPGKYRERADKSTRSSVFKQ